MGDRIAVMNAGRIEQIDTPEVIYHDPNSLFVADFIGSPAINFFEMTYDGEAASSETFDVDLPGPVASELSSGLPGSDVILGIRPEDMYVTDPGQGAFDTTVDVIEPIGDRQIVYFHVGDRRVNAVVSSTVDVEENQTIGIEIGWANAHFFSPEGPKLVKWGNVADASTSSSTTPEVIADGDPDEPEE